MCSGLDSFPERLLAVQRQVVELHPKSRMVRQLEQDLPELLSLFHSDFSHKKLDITTIRSDLDSILEATV